MMNEIVKARSILSLLSEEEKSYYNLKLETIRECLYGVDIDASAVDIAKLRFWLSLIVDEEDIEKIDPLPNLDHKIMCGNSLIEEFEGMKLFDEKLLTNVPKDSTTQSTLDKNFNLRLKKSQIKLKELKNLQKLFFKEQNIKNKKKYRSEIDRIEWELIEETLKEEGNETSIGRIEDYRNNRSKPFFVWKLYFHDVFTRENPGFDVVIMNPPYLGEDDHKDIFRPIAKGNLADFYQGKMDIFYFFFHLALNIGRYNSQIAFITTNYYPTATGADKLREDFKKRSIIRKLINFSELKIFESAKGQHNMITILQKANDKKFLARNCETGRKGIATPDNLISILNGNDELTEYYNVAQENIYDGEKNYIRLMGTKNEESPIHNILNKIIDESDDLLGNVCEVNQGVISGCDSLSKKLLGKIMNQKDVSLKDGIFVFDLKSARDMKIIKTFSDKEKMLLHPFFKNSEVIRYWCNKDHRKLLLYINKDFQDLKDYPNIKNHLNRFKEVLNDRREVKQGKIKYFSLQWPRVKEIFEKPKICVPYRSDINSFAFNDIPWYCRSDCYVITQKNRKADLKYILALLNSRLYYIWLYYKGKRKGKKLELFQTPLSEIPLKIPSKEQQKIIVDYVNKILNITDDVNYPKNEEEKLNVRKIEKKIDSIIFELYGISDTEKNILINLNDDLFAI